MITKFNSFILEMASTLTRLGVPNEVMKDVQINYEIPMNINWIKINKSELNNNLRKKEKSLFIEINKDYIKIIANYLNSYFIQYYKYDESGWGSYDIKEREKSSLTSVLYEVSAKSIIWKSDSPYFQIKPKEQREVQKDAKDFDYITNDFKMNIIQNFNNICQKMYGNRYEEVMQKIVKNIEDMNKGMSAKRILDFLKDNRKLTQMAKEYDDAKRNDDILSLNDMNKQYNSLPIFDEYLAKFEVAYSEKFKEHLTIRELLNKYTYMKIKTAFIYFLYSGKLMKLEYEKL